MLKITRRAAVITTAAAAALALASGVAVAAAGTVSATAKTASPSSLYACVSGPARDLTGAYTVKGNFKGCPGGFPVTIASVPGKTGAAGPKGATGATGAKGAAGAAGAAGQAGAAGPSGVVSVTTKDLGSVASVPTGGSFVTSATLAGTVSLKAGTYLVSVDAKATPTLASAVQVYPEFFVYDQAANAGFTGDLLNAGAGALESGGNTQIDSYYSGSGVITLSADTTLDLYAFGYDSDRGAGSYALDDLTVTAVQLQAAS